MLAQQTAEDIVVNGLKVATASPAVAQAAAEAHNAYQAKKDALDKAAGELDAARAAYEEASERAGVTEQELAEKLADLAMAQDAYDRLAKQMGWDKPAADGDQGTGVVNDNDGNGTKQQASMETAGSNGKSDLPQTGDPAAAMAAGIALAGAAAVAGGAHFRRRRE
ncbi:MULTISPECIES: LPXTG cell wall anchor domain-containing protein [Enorma]|uniref:LPXTG cell wall anchor domain-containing protein n=1 Tax=Enorma TaxID=1472762 RepID=UPI000348CDCF|nr:MULTISPECIES: LPXTG cell wall anchor domain-containing protein [Enorma]